MYVLGAVEALVATAEALDFAGGANAQVLSLILLSMLFLCVYTGIEYVAKVGTVFLATVILGRVRALSALPCRDICAGVLCVMLGLVTLGTSVTRFSDSDGISQ